MRSTQAPQKPHTKLLIPAFVFLALLLGCSAADLVQRDVATPIPTPAEVVQEVEPTPARVVAQAPACPDNRALLIRPGNNETVSGVIAVVGSATHDAFQYYKVEYAPGANADSNFGYLVGGNAPVVNGVLGNVDTNTLGNGAWTLRLIVVDQTGNFPPPCKVTINVQN